MRFEVDIDDCTVHGEIPRTLNAGFYRVGPTLKHLPRDGALGFPAMDGMVQAMIFDTQGIDAGPIATIELPVQIGWTPHGHYMDMA